jgi:hypothetical protein
MKRLLVLAVLVLIPVGLWVAQQARERDPLNWDRTIEHYPALPPEVRGPWWDEPTTAAAARPTTGPTTSYSRTRP